MAVLQGWVKQKDTWLLVMKTHTERKEWAKCEFQLIFHHCAYTPLHCNIQYIDNPFICSRFSDRVEPREREGVSKENYLNAWNSHVLILAVLLQTLLKGYFN